MKYKEIRDSLFAKDFKIKSIQTGYNLEVPSFQHPKIDGEIFVSFGECDIKEGTFIDYSKSEFLNDIEIEEVSFNINMSISFMSNGMIATSNEESENIIILHEEDIDKHFHTVLNIISDPYSVINFSEKYFEEVKKFNQQVKEFIPILNKHDFKLSVAKSSGDEGTLYSDFQLNFDYQGRKHDYVTFQFNVLSWEHVIYMSMGGKKFHGKLNMGKDEFDIEVQNHIIAFNDMMEKWDKRERQDKHNKRENINGFNDVHVE